MQHSSHENDNSYLVLFEQAFCLFHDKRMREERSLAALPTMIPFEKRGVKLLLFQRLRDLCLSKNAAPGYWTIGRLGALVIGNHEILRTAEKDAKEAEAIAQGKTSEYVYRWGKDVDPASTLTYAGQCSLIEMLRQGRFESDAPLGSMSYEQVVGAKADIFVSFAYSCDFIELVDALECFFERTPSLDKNSTYLWFDLFVNDQWTALDKPFEWWATTFKEAVEEIGHTVVVMLPWEAPIPLTRVWCLFEISCSQKLSIALSRKQVEAFQRMLRIDFEVISASLFKIDVENASSFLPEDKERIFAAVRSIEGGFHGLNVKVTSMIREWAQASARALLQQEGPEGEGDGSDLFLLGQVMYEAARFADAEELWKKTLHVQERTIGRDALDTLRTIEALANLYGRKGLVSDAEEFYRFALQGYRLKCGDDSLDVCSAMNNLANLFYSQEINSAEAEELYRKALKGKERWLGRDNASTLMTVYNLAALLRQQGKIDEATALYLRVIRGGPEKPLVLAAMNNLGSCYIEQNKFEMAQELLENVLRKQEKAQG